MNKKSVRMVLLTVVLSAWLVGLVSSQEQLASISVKAGEKRSSIAPVSVSLEGFPVDGLQLVMIQGKEKIPVSCQVEPGLPPRLWWIVKPPLKPGEERLFHLLKGKPDPARSVRIEVDEKSLLIRLEEKKVLNYHHALVPPPEGFNKNYTRSGFIHPLWSPAGEELTWMHPRDHIHHLGIWNPWTKTKFEGREVDFWNLKKGQGTVRFVCFASKTEGPVFGGFRALHEHVDLQAPGGERVALMEEWDVRVWNLGEPDRMLCDFTSTLNCASTSPILLDKYRYGGFGFRATSKWNEGNYLTSEGKERKDGQGSRARWCMVFGPTGKGPAGIVFMSHPQNREHPEPMRIWSHCPEIFFSFCPIQAKAWTLEPGKDYQLRYRMLVYNGKIDPEEAEKAWCGFGHPPERIVIFPSKKD